MTQAQHEKLNPEIYKLMDNSQYSYQEARIICAAQLNITLEAQS